VGPTADLVRFKRNGIRVFADFAEPRSIAHCSAAQVDAAADTMGEQDATGIAADLYTP